MDDQVLGKFRLIKFQKSLELTALSRKSIDRLSSSLSKPYLCITLLLIPFKDYSNVLPKL